MNTVNLLNWMLYPLLTGAVALFLLCLSVWEFRKPSAVAKLKAFTLSAFGVGFGSLALMLYITTGASWAFRGNHLLIAVATLLLGLTALCMLAGIALLLAVVARVRGDQEGVPRPTAQPSEGVWPPPPRTP